MIDFVLTALAGCLIGLAAVLTFTRIPRRIAVLAGITLALYLSAPAKADTDQYLPNPPLWCPGNNPGTIVALGYGGYCEGRNYPDGTRWNTYRIGWFWQPLRCVIFDGTINPPTAPAGGCGGNWAG